MKTLLPILFCWICWAMPHEASSQVIVASPSTFRAALDTLEPGDTLHLVPGNYTLSLRMTDIVGTAAEPIVISGQPAQPKPVFIGNSCCNTVSLTRCAFVEIRDLILNGQNIAGIDGLKAEGSSGNWTHDIWVEGLEINGYGADQQNVGISTKCPSWNWIVRNNVIDAAGTGMYFGNSNGEEPFVNGMIEYNLIQNTVGYNCQVKHQNVNTRDLMLGMPANAKTIIRYNVFSKAQNASKGSSARPNLLVGNFPASGAGEDDHYEIYGNFFFQNPVEALFQGTGNIGFYNNVLFNEAGGWGVSIQTHNGFQPRDIDIFFNTVVIADGAGINLSGLNSSYTQRVQGNLSMGPNPINGGQLVQNITDSYANANNYINSPFLPLTTMNHIPLGGSSTIAGITLNDLSGYENSSIDFDGFSRDGTRAGAYAGLSGPLWQLQLAIRDEVLPTTTTYETEIRLEQQSIELFPTPSSDYIQLEGVVGSYQIQLLNAAGMVIETIPATSSPWVIDLRHLDVGCYFILIQHNDSNKPNLSVQKILKIN